MKGRSAGDFVDGALETVLIGPIRRAFHRAAADLSMQAKFILGVSFLLASMALAEANGRLISEREERDHNSELLLWFGTASTGALTATAFGSLLITKRREQAWEAEQRSKGSKKKGSKKKVAKKGAKKVARRGQPSKRRSGRRGLPGPG